MSESTTSTPLVERIVESLAREGFKPEADGNRIAFTVNEQTLQVIALEGEMQFINVMGQWNIPGHVSDDVERRLQTANDIQLNAGCLKMAVIGDVLMVGSEHLIRPDQEDLTLELRNGMALVLTTSRQWLEAMQGEEATHLSAPRVGGSA